MYWLSSLFFYLALCVVALFVGAVAGVEAGLLLALVTISAVLVYHLINLARLNFWLQAPALDSAPRGFLLWREAFDRIYELVRNQQKRKNQLSATLDRFQRAGEAMPDGMVILDEHDRIEWCNPAAARHLGLNRQADISQQLTNLIRTPALREYLREQDFSQPLVLRMPRPQEQVLTIQLVPFDSNRKLLLSRDITQLDRVQTVHRDFVANVSHELRTPLTVVGGFIETMLDMPDIDPETREQHLKLMFEQTGRMQRLVDDLLALSRLESGQQLKEEEVNVPQMLQILQTEAEGLSQGRHRIVIDAVAPLRLIGNNDELHSAFGNLVSNAIRYTPQGGTIGLRWEMRADQPVFTVHDTGIGIAPEHIPRLTERFYRIDRGRSRATGGTGLGLAIVKHVLQRHQARLVVQSRLGEGSEFAVYFPAERALT
ncbi:MAG: phosphate regulon sensor histidine kinase PhoR [Proteobacteria bacterium]|nr:phosphate regulon sensor histidine kinase PhoR [Pseudomonadota bacterium]